MPPPLIGGALSDAFVWRLSVVYIGSKSRTERHRKTKIGTEVAHVTRDSDTTFKVKKSKVKVTRPLCSPPCWRVRRLHRWAWERVGRGKLLLRCRLLGGAKRFAPPPRQSHFRACMYYNWTSISPRIWIGLPRYHCITAAICVSVRQW